MRTRPLGQSGIGATVVGLGTWAIGGWMWGGTDEADAIDAIRAGIDAGINLIDTAPAYGLGLSEEIVGKAIAGRRDRVVLATKCGLVWHTQKGKFFFTEEGRPVHRYLGPESIRHELEESLRRLGTDVIDLYQTHWQDPTTPIEETMAALMDLKREGKIRAIGVSNATPEEIDAYRKVGPVDTDQERYSMVDRELEERLLPYCLKHDIAVLAYSPLARGLLTGRCGPDRAFTGDDQRIGDPQFCIENRERVARLLGEIKPLADARGLTLSQLVIAWTIAQPGLTHALAGARNAAQAVENAGGDVALGDSEIAAIDAALACHAA